MRMTTMRALGVATVLGLVASAALAATPAIQAALADPARPAADRDRDGPRHAAEVLEFAGLKPGDKVADYMPGAGYFTRIFSAAVGPKGHVYATFPDFMAKFETKEVAAETALVADPHDKLVFDSSIRGKTDQVVFRFKRPA